MYGHSKIYLISGGIIEAEIINGLIHGEGRIHFPNGDITIGIWKKGKLHGKVISFDSELNTWRSAEYMEGRQTNIYCINSSHPIEFGI